MTAEAKVYEDEEAIFEQIWGRPSEDMTDAKQVLRETFRENRLGVGYCPSCDTIVLKCSECYGTTCNGMGCDRCDGAFTAFLRQKKTFLSLSVYTEAMHEREISRKRLVHRVKTFLMGKVRRFGAEAKRVLWK